MADLRPDWLDVSQWQTMAPPTPGQIHAAIHADSPGIAELAVLLSPEAAPLVEEMARKAQILARRHFGRTTMLYVPLYLSNYCTGGCAYCGFASDRDLPRQRLELDQVEKELSALRRMGFAEVLLLTGERHPEADLDYVLECVRLAAARFPNVTVEMFPLPTEEYERLCAAGCTGVTIYQETYDPAVYECMHRWGPKSDYLQRLEAPERVLAAGMRTCGIGALLGLASPLEDALSLYLHARRLQQTHWRAGVSVSFPRIRPQEGGFQPPFPVDEAFLAQLIFAFRIVLPRTHLVLSTREGVRFRDGMAGLGVTKMSAASLTTVGGYSESESESSGQFDVSDHRSVEEICTMLRGKGLEPVFKNWDSVYR